MNHFLNSMIHPGRSPRQALEITSVIRKKKCQPACKPGSVWPLSLRTGTWRPFILGVRCRAPHATYPDGGPKTAPGVSPAPPLFGLAPGGVYHAAPVARSAVGSYPTLSPLPRCRPLAEPGNRGGLLSVALSLGSPPPAINRHRVFVEPGLSSPAAFRRMRVRPPGRLTGAYKGIYCPKRNRKAPEQPTDQAGVAAAAICTFTLLQ